MILLLASVETVNSTKMSEELFSRWVHQKLSSATKPVCRLSLTLTQNAESGSFLFELIAPVCLSALLLSGQSLLPFPHSLHQLSLFSFRSFFSLTGWIILNLLQAKSWLCLKLSLSFSLNNTGIFFLYNWLLFFFLSLITLYPLWE